MKKYILFSIGFLMILILNSCNHTPKKIEKYIKKHCDFSTTDSCSIDLRKALKKDYDTMYVFNSLIPLTGVQNILGIKDYNKSNNSETTLMGKDSEMSIIILVKNNKIVFEDEYYYNNYNIKLSYENFIIVNGKGIFDGNTIDVTGYKCINPIFNVIKNNDYYLVECMPQ